MSDSESTARIYKNIRLSACLLVNVRFLFVVTPTSRRVSRTVHSRNSVSPSAGSNNVQCECATQTVQGAAWALGAGRSDKKTRNGEWTRGRLLLDDEINRSKVTRPSLFIPSWPVVLFYCDCVLDVFYVNFMGASMLY